MIFILLLQQLDGNFIGPKILGNSTGLSSFWVIFSILLGGGLFGFLGMLLGVPTFAVIYYIIELIIDGRLHRKNLPESSDYYDEYSFVDDTGKYVISRETMEKKHKEKCEKEKSWERKKGNTMPIRVQNDLPVKEILESENIFVMDEHRATHQDIRPIQIGLLNLMPLKKIPSFRSCGLYPTHRCRWM